MIVRIITEKKERERKKETADILSDKQVPAVQLRDRHHDHDGRR